MAKTERTWGTSQTGKKKSTFFKGISIFEQLINSSFGKIKHAFEELFSEEDVSNYKLPKVIVIGNESTGKSSLLENITKCQIFPRDSKICTKCPIHLKLNNGSSKYNIIYGGQVINVTEKTNIYGNIVEIMKRIPDDNISEEEIVVTIIDNGLPNFEFYDLPGIRAYPPKSVEVTMNLCRKYLQDRNSIVLCVVPATTTRLTACQSIALIQEMHMEHNCILALTMADRLQFENIEELLIKRIIGISDEVLGLNFAGCVAIVNRLHTDVKALDENDKIEEKWFSRNILTKIPEIYKGYEDTISDRIGVANLLCIMDDLYDQFIQTDWKPKLLESIHNKIEGFEDELSTMGIDVSDIDVEQLNADFNNFLKQITYMRYVHTVESENSTDYFEQYYNMIRLVDALLKYYEEDNVHIDYFLSQVDNFFTDEYPLKLVRFSGLKKSLRVLLQTTYLELAKNNELIKQKVINFADMFEVTSSEEVKRLFDKYFLLFRIQPLKETMYEISLDDLVEGDEYREKRRLLELKLQRAKDHMAKITGL